MDVLFSFNQNNYNVNKKSIVFLALFMQFLFDPLLSFYISSIAFGWTKRKKKDDVDFVMAYSILG